MITAKITAIKSGRNGGVPFAFAKASDLQSDYNPDGSVTFSIVPDIWRGRALPRVGETVFLGQLKKRVKPEWPAPRWRAFEAKPVNGRPLPRASMRTPAPIQRSVKESWINRFCAFFRFDKRANQRSA